MKKLLLVSIMCLVSLCGLFSYTYAQEENQDLTKEAILTFASDITVHEDNSIDVIETLVYNTGTSARHGIYRDIDTASSQMRKMSIENIAVTDENNVPYLFEVIRDSGTIGIKIGDPNTTFTGIRTYVLHYRATNAVGQLEDRDEIYWNVTGNRWNIPLYETRATITLPTGAQLIKAKCYYGTRGSNNTCDSQYNISTDDENFTFESPAPLYPGRELTVAVGFHKGIVAPYTDIRGMLFIFFNTYPDWFIASILPLCTLIISFIIWYRRGRDPRGTGVIVPQYDVPDGLTPMEVAGIVYEKVKPKHISAEILYLATQGYLMIHQLEKSSQGFGKRFDYELIRQKESSALPNDFDRKLLDGLFNKDVVPEASRDIQNNQVKLSHLRYRFYKDMVPIIKSVANSLLDKGYYKNLGKIKSAGNNVFSIFTISSMIFIFLMSIFQQFIIGDRVPIFIVAVASSAIIYSIALYLSPSKTTKGVASKEYLLGLRDYLQIAEKDRLEFHNAPDKNPETFEKLLPYAMVFGVADIWAKEFEGISMTSPSWYTGHMTTGLSPLAFVNSIGDFTTYTNKALSSSPSGGSGGGGSAGGGGGGGGGGGW